MGLLDGVYGAIIGAAIAAACALLVYRLQKKSSEDLAARQQRNDIARAAHLLIVELQSGVLKVAADSAAHQGDPDVAHHVKRGVGELLDSLTNEKGISPRLEQCCPKQLSQFVDLISEALRAAPTVGGDALKLFNVCLNLSDGLSSIRRDLIALIRE